MSAGDLPIVVVFGGRKYRFESLAVLATYAEKLMIMADRSWKDRASAPKLGDLLSRLAGQADLIAAITGAGLRRIEDDAAQAQAALDEIDRLFGELQRSEL